VDLERAKVDWRTVAAEARPAAEKRVHARLVLDAVARRERIEVAAEELEAALARIAAEQKLSAGQVRRALDQDGRLARLRGQMLRAKTIRRLLGDEAPGKSGEAVAVEGGEGGEEGPGGAAEAASSEPSA
jgi:FKBP-type peptidyl-prolyl cis-trans isomerase (trigger factor)